ncbi:MAG: class I tRNA ligase family protein, partial [Clostridiales bacterium]|nr:class I tRNA ligase family protein [Clostridiales bacterium]
GISPGNDMRFKTDRLEASRNFANKLWNASRFVIMNLLDDEGNFKEIAPASAKTMEKLKDEDKWIISKINEAALYVTDVLDKFELALAGQKVYEVTWNELCDWYIELVKGRLYGGSEEEKAVCRYVLVRSLKDVLKMLHPFMPFITEEIWGYLPKEGNREEFLMLEPWPEHDGALKFEDEAVRMEMAMEAIRNIRNIRAEAEAPPSKKLRAVIYAVGGDMECIRAGEGHIKNLANLSAIEFTDDKSKIPEEVMSAVMSRAEVFIPLDDLVDYKAEHARLSKEKERLSGEIARIGGKLANAGFIGKAPEKIVNDEKEKLAKYEGMLEKVIERLELAEKKL